MDTRRRDIAPWPVNSTRELTSNRIFDLSARRSTSPVTDREHEFYVLECTDWVNVIPLRENGDVVLIRQWRHGTREVTLEIPGGMVDPEDADPGEAARRELLEETGYHAGKVERLGAISPNPAILNNLCHSYLATDLSDRGTPSMDGTEDIDVVEVPLTDVPRLISDGEIVHALVVVAFTYYFGLQP